MNFKSKEIIYAILILVFALIITCDKATSPELNRKFFLSVSAWNAPDSGGVSNPIRIFVADSSIIYSWTIKNDSAWLTLSSDSGSTPSEFTITIDSNVTGLDRVAKMVVTIDDKARSSEEFTVSQNSRHGLIQVGNYRPPYCSEALFVEDDFAYMGGCVGGLIVVDIRDSSHPYDYSWHTSECHEQRIFKSGDYVYVTGLRSDSFQLSGLVEIYSVSDPLNPRIQSRISADYTIGGAVSGDYLYLADYNSLRIYDISDPTHPDSVAYISTTGGTIAAAIYQNFIIFSETDMGIHIMDISDPVNPIAISNYQISGYVSDIFISGHYAFLACYKNGIKILDLSNPNNPAFASGYSTYGQAFRVYANENYAYVAALGNYVDVLNITDIANPMLITSYKTPTQICGVSAAGNYVYVIDRHYGLYTLRFLP